MLYFHMFHQFSHGLLRIFRTLGKREFSDVCAIPPPPPLDTDTELFGLRWFEENCAISQQLGCIDT